MTGLKTKENLNAAWAGEALANRRYLAFAKKADEEGYSQVGKVFRAIATSEAVHSLNHLQALGGVRTTKDNLEAALALEGYENTAMYPEFAKMAEAEEDNDAVKSFKCANDAEKFQIDLVKKALEKMGSLEKTEYYICKTCGYLAESKAPEQCPCCSGSKNQFTDPHGIRQFVWNE